MVKASFLIEFEDESQVVRFERYVTYDLKTDIQTVTILPDDKWLYDKDETFRTLVKGVKKAKNIKDEYYNNQKLKR